MRTGTIEATGLFGDEQKYNEEGQEQVDNKENAQLVRWKLGLKYVLY